MATIAKAIAIAQTLAQWLSFTPCTLFILLPLCLLLYFQHEGRCKDVYLMDISCFCPPPWLRAPHSTFLEHSKLSNIFNHESLTFQHKILERCGVGQEAAFPMCFRYLPPKPSMAAAQEEMHTVMFSCVDELLSKTHISPKDIAIVVANCSTFTPIPSLTSLLVNKYKLRSNVKSFNLGGMGCSAGVIAMDLAKHALQVNPHTYALVFSTENITQNWYWGNNRTMLVSNCLFRMGGAAILLSNKKQDKRHAKYCLEHVVRTHKGADDAAYHAAYQEDDSERKSGVFLSKDLMRIAAEALTLNMTTLGPLVLPYSEQLLFLCNLILRKAFKPHLPAYVPNFRSAFHHFCIHSGGRAVIAAVQKGLKLEAIDVEPTLMTLYRFGNTSSSTTWYQFQYLEAKGRVKKGDRIWQISFGSGFKCNSAVWSALRTIHPLQEQNAWNDFIEEYPVFIPEKLEL